MFDPEKQAADLARLYRELGDGICLYPFFGAFYQTNNVVPDSLDGMPNSVRPCSIVTGGARRDTWSITDGSITNARNSSLWRKMREDFLAGKFHEIEFCQICSSNEKAGTTSPRMMNNKFYTEFLDIDLVEAVKKIEANDLEVTDILTLDYYPSNYCNYSCVMCAGGASSQRHTFEIKIYGSKEKIMLNEPDADFLSVLDKVKIINFTGGETVLQNQVHTMIDYLIERDMAKDLVITLLTNASSFPEKLIEKFRNFKAVIYNVSIDGTKEVIEYQRRGCRWADVETNAIRLMNHEFISSVINFVLTGINALSVMDFIDWAYANGFGRKHENDTCNYITVSPVFRVEHLGVAALPPDLRELALARLDHGRKKYMQMEDTIFNRYFVEIIDRFVSVIENTPYQPRYLPLFIRQIRTEDSASRRTLTQAVPEWAPYFTAIDDQAKETKVSS